MSLANRDLQPGQRYLIEHLYRYAGSVDEIEILEVSLQAVKVKFVNGTPHWVKRSSGRCMDGSLDNYKMIEQLSDAPAPFATASPKALAKPQEKETPRSSE